MTDEQQGQAGRIPEQSATRWANARLRVALAITYGQPAICRRARRRLREQCG
ncbi:hypothetical protein ACWIGW_45535 [Nocardia brasiliensis]